MLIVFGGPPLTVTDGKCRINEEGSDKKSAKRGKKLNVRIWVGKDVAENMPMLPLGIRMSSCDES